MATAGAAAAAAPVTGAAAPVTRQQRQEEAEALFASKHAELLSEARDVAREHGVTVRTVAFRPDGTAVAHDLIGVGREERLRGMVARAVARDVLAMGPQEVAAHYRQLHALRAVVLRELQAKKTATAVAEVTTNKDDDAGTKKTKRALEQREMNGAGAGAAGNAAESNKTRRTD